MPSLQNLTENTVRAFAGEVIFKRGLDYFKDDLVHEFEYLPNAPTINAEVYGNYGDYDVEITETENIIDAYCSCPYDGYPCKHIVAVLLYFIHNKGKYQKKWSKEKEMEQSLEGKLDSLSKSELINLILIYTQKNPSLKRDLWLHFAIDNKKTISQIKKMVDKAFPEITTDYYSTSAIVRELRKILKQVESSSNEVKYEIYWKIVDRILYELNEYGMDDFPLEEFVIKVINLLTDLLIENSELTNKHQDTYARLLEYYEWGNCGIVDYIAEAADKISPQSEL